MMTVVTDAGANTPITSSTVAAVIVESVSNAGTSVDADAVTVAGVRSMLAARDGVIVVIVVSTVAAATETPEPDEIVGATVVTVAVTVPAVTDEDVDNDGVSEVVDAVIVFADTFTPVASVGEPTDADALTVADVIAVVTDGAIDVAVAVMTVGATVDPDDNAGATD